MDSTAYFRTNANRGGVSALLECEAAPDAADMPTIVLPLLSRSASLLTRLLQDGATDLELASSVVGLDPGLAFATLQLANRDRPEGNDAVWQLAPAVVAAGRNALRHLVQEAPWIESCRASAMRLRLHRLASNAVLRATMAHRLAREMGGCNPRRAFLSGLLLDLPLLVELAAVTQVERQDVLSVLRDTMPTPAAKVAAMTNCGEEKHDAGSDPLIAAVLLAERFLQSRISASNAGAIEKLVESALWRCWEQTPAEGVLLPCRCEAMARWTEANWHRMNPWEFMARLESSKPWE